MKVVVKFLKNLAAKGAVCMEARGAVPKETFVDWGGVAGRFRGRFSSIH